MYRPHRVRERNYTQGRGVCHEFMVGRKWAIAMSSLPLSEEYRTIAVWVRLFVFLFVLFLVLNSECERGMRDEREVSTLDAGGAHALYC